MKRKNPRGLKIVLGDTDYELLGLLSTDEGKSSTELGDEVELSSSSVGKHITTLRGLGLVKRRRVEDKGLLIYLTEKGERFLEQKNPKIKSSNQEVTQMAVNVKIQDDICEELEQLMEEENLSSYSEAVDFALADYFGLEEESEAEELEETR